MMTFHEAPSFFQTITTSSLPTLLHQSTPYKTFISNPSPVYKSTPQAQKGYHGAIPSNQFTTIM